MFTKIMTAIWIEFRAVLWNLYYVGVQIGFYP